MCWYLPVLERTVDVGLQVEDMITDRQIVLEPEWRQNNAVTDGER